jgi:hypothetical protein
MRMLRGKGDPYPEDGAIPFAEEWKLCERLGWSWEDCENTPENVRDTFLLIMQCEDAAKKLQG